MRRPLHQGRLRRRTQSLGGREGRRKEGRRKGWQHGMKVHM
jgi:hypothetical protein